MHVHPVYLIAWIAIHVSQTMSYHAVPDQSCDCHTDNAHKELLLVLSGDKPSVVVGNYNEKENHTQQVTSFSTCIMCMPVNALAWSLQGYKASQCMHVWPLLRVNVAHIILCHMHA